MSGDYIISADIQKICPSSKDDIDRRLLLYNTDGPLQLDNTDGLLPLDNTSGLVSSDNIDDSNNETFIEGEKKDTVIKIDKFTFECRCCFDDECKIIDVIKCTYGHSYRCRHHYRSYRHRHHYH
jgi:hypothetical protein